MHPTNPCHMQPVCDAQGRQQAKVGLGGECLSLRRTRISSFWTVLSLQTVAMAATTANKEGFEMQREGVKKAAADTILTPRFYTTDFDECAQIFSKEFNEHLDMKELEAVRDEFVKDYNQNHFVRNDNFKAAASWVDGVFPVVRYSQMEA